MRLLITLLGFFFVSSVHAEDDKQFVCVKDTAETIRELLSYESLRDEAERCRGKAFGHRIKYIFDAYGFVSEEYSNAVMQTHNCENPQPNAPVGVKVSKSYQFITFRWGQGGDYPSTFNIDRNSLRGGYDKKRDYQCKLSDWIPRII